MRESNFYFPAHNKASVSITSALYDRRAIDATSPLPLLSTLTHLSYLTSTSPRIREILCSDGGLERLISILRSTGRRMREQRRALQIERALVDPHYYLPYQYSPPPHPHPNHPNSTNPSTPVTTTTTINTSNRTDSSFNNYLQPPIPSSSSTSSSCSSSSSASSSTSSSASSFSSAVHPSHPFPISSSTHHTQSSYNPTLNHSSQPRHLIQVSPFRPFLASHQSSPPSLTPHPTTTTPLNTEPIATTNDTPTTTPFTPFTNQINPQQLTPSHAPLPSHQVATLGLTKEQKQLLWTWSLSFQCVVNIGVRGTESIRTRVVEAGIVPVIISVLGGYLHEMERLRQQSENLERTRKKAALLATPVASLSGHSRQLPACPFSRVPPSSHPDLPRPPRPVLSSRTLVQPLLHSSSPRSTSDLPSGFSIAHPRNTPIPLPSSPSPTLPSISPVDGRHSSVINPVASSSHPHPHPHRHPHQVHRVDTEQFTIREELNVIAPDPSGRRDPVSINSINDPVLRTGSISPSSVSSSSSLETSRLQTAQQSLLRNIGSTASSALDHPTDLIDINTIDDHDHDHDQARVNHTNSGSHSRVTDQMDDQSAADEESEADVVMELVGGGEPGPSNGRPRSRRGTIKASQVNPHAVVHITPLAPSRPILTELNHVNLPFDSQTQPSPMEGVVDTSESQTESDSPTSAFLHNNNNQTPRASSARLPQAGSGRIHSHGLVSSTFDSNSENALGVPSSSRSISQGSTSHTQPTSSTESVNSSSLQPRVGGAPPNDLIADVPQLPPVLSDSDDVSPPHVFHPHRHVADVPPAAIAPTPAPNLLDQTAPAAPTGRPTPLNTSNLGSPVTLAFRDEDVLLALQLLAYLSKYAHVRAYFHEPASRSTLELAYGSLHDATRALARFTGRFKNDRYERERAKDLSTNIGGIPSSSRRPASAQDLQSSSPYLDNGLGSPNDLSDGMRHMPHTHHSHYPHRSLSSSMMRERMLADEAQEQVRMLSRSRELPSGYIPPRTSGSDPGTDHLRPGLLLGGITLFSTSPLANTFPQTLRQPSFVAAQSGASSLIPTVAPHHHHSSITNPTPNSLIHDLGGESNHPYHQPRTQLMISSNLSTPVPSSAHSPIAINPLASNVFSYVERFTHQRLPHDTHSPAIPNEIQYWAGVIMRNACRKDETRGGIRQCANMQCGKWETVPREFAKCRRCRKAKYCSKNCQSRAWQHGHRFWCSTRAEGEGSSMTNGNVGNGGAVEGANAIVNEIVNEITDRGEPLETTRPTDRTSRALVDAAIERLRRDPSIGTAGGIGGGGRSMHREISEVNSNIATPPDRETRVGNPIDLVATTVTRTDDDDGHHHERGGNHHLVHHHHQGDTMIIGNGTVVGRPNGVVVNGIDDLVDERDQIRLMVENREDGQVVNP